MPTVMVIDDEKNILELISFALQKDGYRVLTATDGNNGFKMVKDEMPDVVILDIMLPGQDGFEVCKMIRANITTSNIPIIMLSARVDVVDRVLGLEFGADDYMTKPFSIRELMARVKANLRRKSQNINSFEQGNNMKEIRRNSLVIIPEKYEVFIDKKRLDLSPKEFEILLLLATHPGRVFSRDSLLERLWGFDSLRETRTVDVHIRYLRQKIEPDPAHPVYIETVRGVGYRFRDRA